MKKYLSVIPLVMLLFFVVGCQDKAEMADQKQTSFQTDVDKQNQTSSRRFLEEMEPSEQVFKTEFMWNAKVMIADGILLGKSKYGWRRIVPIIGGTFDGPNISGEVLPGGEDWQLTRPDGDTELYARYLLKTNDGHLIQVINRVLMYFPPDGKKESPYIRSLIDLEAPIDSPYEYLNHAIFLGTLTEPAYKPGEKPYVMIGVYKVL
jgi:hypothetical protein